MDPDIETVSEITSEYRTPVSKIAGAEASPEIGQLSVGNRLLLVMYHFKRTD